LETLIRISFDIISQASILILVVSGLAVIASMMGIFNMSHAAFVTLGGWVVFEFWQAGLPTLWAIVVAPFVTATVGLVVERIVIRRFYTRPVLAVLSTFIVGMIFIEVVRHYTMNTNYFQQIPDPMPGFFELGGLAFSRWRTIIIGVTLLVVVGSYLILMRTKMGLRIRASMSNPALARASGISTNRVYAFTFSFGVALAGLAGAMMTIIYPFYPEMGNETMIKGFLSLLIGGLGNFGPPIIGAFGVGAMGALLPYFVAPVAVSIIVFVVAIIIVKLKPEGLLTKK